MEFADVDYKVQIDINGKPMITHILEAIRDPNYYTYILLTGIPKNEALVPEGIPEDKIEFFMSESTEHMDRIILLL